MRAGVSTKVFCCFDYAVPISRTPIGGALLRLVHLPVQAWVAIKSGLEIYFKSVQVVRVVFLIITKTGKRLSGR